jgi:hypothetical protein
MGLFDRFKKKPQEEVKENKDEQEFNIYDIDSTITTPPIHGSSYTKVVDNEPVVREAKVRLEAAKKEYAAESYKVEKQASDLLSRVDSYLESKPATYADQVAAAKARELVEEAKRTKTKSEFDLRYGAVASFVGPYFLGIKSKDAIEYLKSGVLQESDLDSILYPYLIEKNKCGLIEKSDKSKLASLSGEEEQNRKRYTDGLLLQQKLNLTDLSDEENYSESFALSTLSREELITKAKEGSIKL